MPRSIRFPVVVRCALLGLAGLLCVGAVAKPGTAAEPESTEAPAKEVVAPGIELPIDPRQCEADADCIVKNVGNCCGYYPSCVNVSHEPDLEAVTKKCEEDDRTATCGYPEISHCTCVEHRCRSMQGDVEVFTDN